MEINLRKEYQNKYPTDELGILINQDATLLGLYHCLVEGTHVYEYIYVVDSTVRERLFLMLSETLDKPYSYVYDLWLENIKKHPIGYTKDFIVPVHMAVSIINNDFSGLSDQDVKDIQEWRQSNSIGHMYMPENTEPEFLNYNHVLGFIGADCLKVKCVICD